MEQSRSLDDHNLLSAFMFEHKTGLEGAIEHLKEFNDSRVATFLREIELLPSWGEEIDKEIKFYIDGIGSWVRGEDCWSFESDRYFEDGRAVREHRTVKLLAPSVGYATRRQM